MGDNSEQGFNVYFAGECLEGHDPGQVRAAVAKLFNAGEETLDRLFSGSRQPVKRGCDKGTALKYQRAMKKAGAKAIIERATAAAASSASDGSDERDGSTASEAAAPVPESATASESAGGSGGLTLAPDGTDVLLPEERAQVTPANIPTDHLEALPIGDRLSPEPPPVAPVPMPDFELAASGADLVDTPEREPVEPPSTEGLSLTGETYDLSDCAPPPPDPKDIPMGHLVLAEAGEEMLEAEHRSEAAAELPATDHLSVEDPQNGA